MENRIQPILSIQFNENRQTDLLTPDGVREEVNRVSGEQIRMSKQNRDCRSMKLDERSVVFVEEPNFVQNLRGGWKMVFGNANRKV